MKTIVILLSVFLTQCSSKQNEASDNQKTENQEKYINEGYELKLKKVIADSRCPEGLNCVWEGQVEIIVSVFKENILIEDKELIVNSQTNEKNIIWANNYSKKPITFIGVLPKRIKDQEIKDADYELLIKYD
ncbi:conserved hypothetical protein [Flavobacterium sp. 9AF]|uniref:hypothetical protein n=1 Tax=Flavobacterium sp. 9AF TaxID=2653142 RepID=UPI0012F05197|nr:hypothetical protein [Flavobacterium sp. 9AF]VXB77985.1 conserved hypothetical protein [Flavobacterium sp. 9AF]